jgi:hypothetical protein
MAMSSAKAMSEAAEMFQRSLFREGPALELPAGWELAEPRMRVGISKDWFWFPWMDVPGRVAVGGQTPAACWIVRRSARSKPRSR